MKKFLFVLLIFVTQTLQAHPYFSAGYVHSCFLSDKDVATCFGYNYYGAGAVPRPYRSTKLIKAGYYSTCALDENNETGCWGYANSGFLDYLEKQNLQDLSFTYGVAVVTKDAKGTLKWWVNGSEIESPVGKGPFKAITGHSASGYTCVTDMNDGLRCWYSGGTGSKAIDLSKVVKTYDSLFVSSNGVCVIHRYNVSCFSEQAKPLGGLPSFRRPTKIINHASSMCVIDDGRPLCWSTSNDNVFEMPVPNLKNVSDADSNQYQICLMSDDDLGCYSGANLNSENRYEYTAKIKPDPNRKTIPLSHHCHQKGNELLCLGANNVGQLGNDDKNLRNKISEAKPVPLPADFKIKKHLDGIGYGCALSDAGILYCWGKTDQLDLKKIKRGTTQDFAIGDEFLCALDFDGRVTCTGKSFGSIPGDLMTATKIFSGGTSTCVANDAGKTQCFGEDAESLPKQVLPELSSVSLGRNFGCGILKKDQSIYCWGQNHRGQLARGNTRNKQIDDEALLGQNSSYKNLSCGTYHCCAETIDHQLKCWGDNVYGQLGLGDRISRGVTMSVAKDFLVKLPKGETITALDVRYDVSCITTAKGKRCWGYNGHGHLGNGNFITQGATPETVPANLKVIEGL